ncbi:CobW family GTP-binding protein [Methylobrevis albus]|uniref:GTP-binding protein n=1 Tax=Methylobrevis albus TaxID=2793297 RepID=A0A931I3K6_9HYPH|nr:GTP-binding protein [Methylobrevis albus]MBH0238804.1 GTP-binding protein [Methylobrevis albus]
MTDPRPIDVTLLTGFLGSGKTTLLNNLLRDPGMADTAVVINEFGDVAIDHLLVESAIENAVVLQSGCICCTVRGDLVDTLGDLEGKAARGELPPFSRVVIETTGLADPTAIVRIFAEEPTLAGRFRLRAVVTTVDAVNGAGQLDRFNEAGRQAALADVMVLTKSDLAGETAATDLKARLARINPGASILTVVHGALSPEALFAEVAHPLADGEAGVGRWLGLDAFAPLAPTPGAHVHHGDHGHDHGSGHDHGHDHAHGDHGHDDHAHADHHDHAAAVAPSGIDAHGDAPSRHDAAISSFAVILDDPIERTALERWLASIMSLRGSDLLRMKGIVAVRGLGGPVVVHAVQNVVHPPLRLARWPDADHRTRIVFITQNIPKAALQRSLEVLAAEAVG